MSGGRQRREPPAGLAYPDAAAWAAGPARVYGRFAEAALGVLTEPLGGHLALDAGAGTGAISRALLRRGARVVALDRSEAMVRAGAAPGVVADLTRLPVASHAVSLAAAGFVLSHLEEPAAGLAELARVTRPGGLVLVTGFAAGSHPVKAAADAVLAAAGYRPPAWYAALKSTGEAAVGTPAALRRLAAGAGLRGAEVQLVAVDLRGLTVAAAVGWRLGLAQITPYLAGLPLRRRQQVTAQVRRAVTAVGLDSPMPILVLTARA